MEERLKFPDRLAVFVGQARTGTSLAGDLVNACGWKVVDHARPAHRQPRLGHHLRAGRNEFADIGVELGNPARDVAKVTHRLRAEGCEGVKVGYNFDHFLPFFREHVPDLRLLVMVRNTAAMVASQRAYHRRSGPRDTAEAEAIRSHLLEEYHQDPAYRSIRVDFERLIAKDRRLLQVIADFLDSDVSIDTLAALIHPEVSCYSQ